MDEQKRYCEQDIIPGFQKIGREREHQVFMQLDSCASNRE